MSRRDERLGEVIYKALAKAIGDTEQSLVPWSQIEPELRAAFEVLGRLVYGDSDVGRPWMEG